MSAPRTRGRLTDDEVADVRAIRSHGSSREIVQLVERIADRIAADARDIEWPARSYIYGVWEYALSQARDRAQRNNQKMYVYRGELDGEAVWVVSWDPKR